MPSPDPTAEIEEIKKALIESIDAELEKRPQVYLSTLGAAMGDRLKRLKLLTGQPLATIIEHDYPGRYQVVRLGAHKNVIALLKPGHAPSVESTKPADAPRVRYVRELWIAFALPATAPHRYIDPKTLKFVDSADETAPDGFLPIESEYLRSLDAPHDATAILQRIGTWLAKHKVDPSPYVQKAPAARTHERSGSVLELVLTSLDRRQLQSVSLPLDVIEALLRTRP